jgi:hypothetical protein
VRQKRRDAGGVLRQPEQENTPHPTTQKSRMRTACAMVPDDPPAFLRSPLLPSSYARP